MRSYASEKATDLPLSLWQLSQEGRVLTAAFVNPPLNYLSPQALRELDILTRAVDRDPTVGSVVLTGGVERRFLTLADPSQLAGMTLMPTLPAAAHTWVRLALNVAAGVLRLPGAVALTERFGGMPGQGVVWGIRWKKTILRMNGSDVVYLAAINGPAFGGGHELALACDIRYAADADFVQLGQVEILAGLLPGGGATQRLPRLVGVSRALQHMLNGAPLSAREAYDLGVIHQLVAPEDLLETVAEFAEQLATRSPYAIGAIKRAVYFGSSGSLPRGLNGELASFVIAGTTSRFAASLVALASDADRLHETAFVADPGPWVAGTRIRTDDSS